MPNIENELLQSRSMTPPVIGTIRDDVVFNVEDPGDALVDAANVGTGEVGVGVFVGVTA